MDRLAFRLLANAWDGIPGEDSSTAAARQLVRDREGLRLQERRTQARGEAYGDNNNNETGSSRRERGSVLSRNGRSGGEGAPPRRASSAAGTSSRSGGGERATVRGRRGEREASPRQQQQQLANSAGRRRSSWFATGATLADIGSGTTFSSRDTRSVSGGSVRARTSRREEQREPSIGPAVRSISSDSRRGGEGGPTQINPAVRSISSDSRRESERESSIRAAGRSTSSDREFHAYSASLTRQRPRSAPSQSRSNAFSFRFREGEVGQGESFGEKVWQSPPRTWGGSGLAGWGSGSAEKRGSVDGSDSCDFRDGRTDNGGSQRDPLEEDILGEFLSSCERRGKLHNHCFRLERWVGWGYSHITRGASGRTVDPRILTTPEWSISGFR